MRLRPARSSLLLLLVGCAFDHFDVKRSRLLDVEDAFRIFDTAASIRNGRLFPILHIRIGPGKAFGQDVEHRFAS